MCLFRPIGFVTHGTDRPLWALSLPALTPDQADVARAWLNAVDREVKALEARGSSDKTVRDMLTLKEDRTIGWTQDQSWDEVSRLLKVLPGEA